MGCTNSVPESLKGSTISTEVPPSEWRTNTLALLQQVFPNDQQPWLLELLKGVQVWEDSDFDFRQERRLGDFRLLRVDNLELAYKSAELHPVWALLVEDLGDVRNPVGSLLMSFAMALVRTNLEAAQQVSNELAEASFLLASLTANVLKMTYVLREALISFYFPISDLLRARHEDVERLVLDCIVQGDLYILMQRLANVLTGKTTEAMLKRIHGRESEGGESVARVRELLLQFILTESISEKRDLLCKAETHAQGSRTVVQESLHTLGLQSIEADLVLTKLLAQAPGFLYFLQECLDTCGS